MNSFSMTRLWNRWPRRLLLHVMVMTLALRPSLSLTGNVLVTLLDPNVRAYLGQVATFGRRLDSSRLYDAYIALPPGDPQLCSVPSLFYNASMPYYTRRLKNTWALLIKRGGCTFAQKAENAITMSRNLTKGNITFVVVYNDNTTDPNGIYTMTANDTETNLTDLEDLGLMFVSSESGKGMLQQIRQVELFENASSIFMSPTSGYWHLRIVIQLQTPDPGYDPGSGGSQSVNGGSGGPNFYWLRFVLFALLILSPCCRAAYLWYAGGGRLRWRYNNQGRWVGIQYVRPMPYWYASTLANLPQPNEQAAPCLTEEQVRGLPVITYQPSARPSSNARRDTTARAEEEETSVSSSGARTGSLGDENEQSETASRTASVAGAEIASGVHGDEEQPSPVPSEHTYHTTCSICIDDFDRGDQLTLLPRCRHVFHTECILPWLTERQGCCPLCKAVVIEQASEDNDDQESTASLEDAVEDTTAAAANASSTAVPLASPSNNNSHNNNNTGTPRPTFVVSPQDQSSSSSSRRTNTTTTANASSATPF